MAGECRLVLGGARSGKSAFAERVARETGLERHYIATSRIYDAAHAARIERHRQARAADQWTVHEEPLALTGALQQQTAAGRVVLVDVWLICVSEKTLRCLERRLLVLSTANSLHLWPIWPSRKYRNMMALDAGSTNSTLVLVLRQPEDIGYFIGDSHAWLLSSVSNAPPSFMKQVWL